MRGDLRGFFKLSSLFKWNVQFHISIFLEFFAKMYVGGMIRVVSLLNIIGSKNPRIVTSEVCVQWNSGQYSDIYLFPKLDVAAVTVCLHFLMKLLCNSNFTHYRPITQITMMKLCLWCLLIYFQIFKTIYNTKSTYWLCMAIFNIFADCIFTI